MFPNQARSILLRSVASSRASTQAVVVLPQIRTYAQVPTPQDTKPPVALFGIDGTYANALVSLSHCRRYLFKLQQRPRESQSPRSQQKLIRINMSSIPLLPRPPPWRAPPKLSPIFPMSSRKIQSSRSFSLLRL